MTGPDRSQGWDALHRQDRYRPAYPSEPVVRFVSRRFGGVTSPSAKPATILDLGAGAGRHSLLIEGSGHHVLTVDRSAEGLRHARLALRDQGAPPRIAVCDTTALPFRSGSVDGVVAYGVVNYGTKERMSASIDEVRRLLRPGGWGQVVTRTSDDHRAGQGEPVEPGTVVLDIEETSEPGMLMRFIDRAEVDSLFAGFAEVIVDRIDHTSGGGAIANSDWVVEVRR